VISVKEKMSKEKIKRLEKAMESAIKRIEQMEKRIESLESRLETKDRRFKEGTKRVMGFSLIKCGKYYQAAKNIGEDQLRIYIGKDIDENKVKEKIKKWLNENNWAKNAIIKACPEIASQL
jgi:hypothetical protein